MGLKKLLCLIGWHSLGWSPAGYNYNTKKDEPAKVSCTRCWRDFSKTHVGRWVLHDQFEVRVEKRK